MSDVTVPPVADTVPPAAPAFDPQAAIAGLTQSGYHVFSNDYKFDPAVPTDNPFVKSIVNATTSRFYEMEDAEITAQTGISRNQGEKTYAFRNRVIQTLKEQAQSVPDVEKVKQEYETKLKGQEKALAEVALANHLASLKLNVPEAAAEHMRETLLMRILSMPHRIEGRQVIFQKYSDDGSGLIDINDPTTNKPLAPLDMLKKEFAMYLAPVETPAQGPNKTPAKADTSKPIPKDAKEIAQQLIDEKFQIGSKAYNDELQARKIAYAIA